MSWTASGTATADGAMSLTFSPPYDEADTPVVEQIEIASAVAKQIVASGAVGGADKEFRIGLNGHANADHEPAPGWSNDCVTVSVYQS